MSEEEEESFGELETLRNGGADAVSEGRQSFGDRETLRDGEGWGIVEEWGGKRWKAGEEILGRYVVEKELGQGGMGVVYGCFDKVGGVRVAVKALPPELSHNSVEMEEVRENFELVYHLSHPNIAAVKTLERDGKGEYFLVMEEAEGESLRKWLRRKRKEGGVGVEEAVGVLRQVAAALDYAHGERVVHRDVKPGNVMIDGRGRVKVLDFGLAAQIRTSLSRASRVYRGTSGTGPYMAPEQWEGKQQDGKADQYALGVMAYEMLAGHLPFENSELAVLKDAVLHGEADLIPGLPRGTMGALRRAMAKRKEERFGSCGEFVAALEGTSGRRNVPGTTFMGWVAVLALLGVALWWGGEQASRPEGSPQPERVMEADESPMFALPAEIAEAVEEEPTIDPPDEAAPAIAEEPPDEPEAEEPADEVSQQAEEETWPILEEDEPPALPVEAVQVEEEGVEDTPPEPTPEEREAAWRAEQIALEEARTRLDNLQWTVGQMAERLEEFRQEPLGFEAPLARARKAAETIAGAEVPGSAAEAGETLARVTEASAVLGEVLGWLNRNREARDAAMAVEREIAESLDSGLREFNASEAAAAKFEAGAEAREEGTEALEAGDFPKALDKLSEAKGILGEALDDARSFRAESLVKIARQYKDAERWEKCREAAQEALKAVPDHEEAAALAQEAESNIVPSLHVEAVLDGNPVVATVTCAGQLWGTTPLDKTLEAGGDYELLVEYVADGKCHAGSMTVDAKARGITHATVSLQEWIEPNPGEERDFELANGETIRMVWCPAGSFWMGSRDIWNAKARRHQVTLTKGFWLAKCEVTQKQWQSVMGTSLRQQRDKENASWPLRGEGDDYPMYYVNWTEAKDFCRKTGLRLPTEAEWEYACVSGDEWRHAREEEGRLETMGWVSGNSYGGTHPVGQKEGNEWGLHDMHGNVWEWCADWYLEDMGNWAVVDPSGPGSGTRRVDRGGSWHGSADFCRSSSRDGNSPDVRSNRLGFRPAKTLP